MHLKNLKTAIRQKNLMSRPKLKGIREETLLTSLYKPHRSKGVYCLKVSNVKRSPIKNQEQQHIIYEKERGC